MEMRIVVPDTASVSALSERLMVAFGSECVSVRDQSPEVDVRVEGESDRNVLEVVYTVERWLEEASVGFAEMWLGEHSYRLARWVPVDGWR
jgi:hypothetical protein